MSLYTNANRIAAVVNNDYNMYNAAYDILKRLSLGFYSRSVATYEIFKICLLATSKLDFGVSLSDVDKAAEQIISEGIDG